MQLKEKKQSIVKPSVSFGDEKEHPLAVLFDSPNPPLIKSIGYMRVPDKNTFVTYTIYSRGKEIVSVEVEEPNLRAIAEESAKIAFVSNFCNDEG